MKTSVLIKVLEGMYHACRNKTIELSFYETKFPVPKRRPNTREEFDNNLPETYYLVSVSANNKTMQLMRKSPGKNRAEDQVISVSSPFDFDDLAKIKVANYTVHTYREISPFAKDAHPTERTGVYKTYEECLKFDATLFVTLFKLMGETISLLIESRGKLYHGHYLEGKIVIVDTNDWAITVKVADFFNLNSYLPEYEVVDFVPYPYNMWLSMYVQKLKESCEKGGLQYQEL